MLREEELRDLLHVEGGKDPDSGQATGVQHNPTSQQVGISSPGSGNECGKTCFDSNCCQD